VQFIVAIALLRYSACSVTGAFKSAEAAFPGAGLRHDLDAICGGGGTLSAGACAERLLRRLPSKRSAFPPGLDSRRRRPDASGRTANRSERSPVGWHSHPYAARFPRSARPILTSVIVRLRVLEPAS
jgi:hypothetical protein